MNRKLIEYISLIGGTLLLIVFWGITIKVMLSDNVHVSEASGGRFGPYTYVGQYSLLVYIVPISILWGIYIYKFFRAPVEVKNIEIENLTTNNKKRKRIKRKKNK